MVQNRFLEQLFRLYKKIKLYIVKLLYVCIDRRNKSHNRCTLDHKEYLHSVDAFLVVFLGWWA